MTKGTDIDVLVAGAGPTGLVLASELLRRGLTVRIVDPSLSPTLQSRAIIVHARTLEIFDDMGIGAALLDRGQRLHGANLWAHGSDLIAKVDFSALQSRHNYLLSVAQAETETVLGDLLSSRGGRVERGTRLVSFRQDGTGLTATLAREDGGTETCRAAWLAGCDGAHSTVRKCLGVPFEGETYEDGFLLADVRVEWDVPSDRLSTWFGNDGLIACFPMIDGRWRLICSMAPGDERSEPPPIEEITARLRTLSRKEAIVHDATWLARFRVHCRQVARYRDDRVCLAGDAAHIHSPAGGQGMNIGIQDAHNLAWKLALVHEGSARGLLLDSYDRERHTIGKAILAATDAATRIGIVQSPLLQGLRNQVMRFFTSFEAVQNRVAETLAELDLSYTKSAIVREDATGLLHARSGSAASGETPNLAAARAFASGPAAGRRAPDGPVTSLADGASRRLMEHIDSRTHTVLLFDGKSASASGYTRFSSIAASLSARFGSLVSVAVVTPHRTRPAGLLGDLSVLVDTDGEIERLYGAITECLYVIRPDLWIGYRSQPADEAKLIAWFEGFLR